MIIMMNYYNININIIIKLAVATTSISTCTRWLSRSNNTGSSGESFMYLIKSSIKMGHSFQFRGISSCNVLWNSRMNRSLYSKTGKNKYWWYSVLHCIGCYSMVTMVPRFADTMAPTLWIYYFLEFYYSGDSRVVQVLYSWW